MCTSCNVIQFVATPRGSAGCTNIGEYVGDAQWAPCKAPLKTVRVYGLLEDDFGDTSIVRTIRRTDYQEVLSRGEAVQIKGESFVLGIDYTVH